jgi:RNA polymerase sigma factor (sigma-70 family)
MVAADDRDFTARYDALRRLAYRPAYRLLGSRAAGEDIADETLARAFARWRRISSHADAWVVRVATNLALDVGRERARAARQGQALVDPAMVDPHSELRLDLQAALRSLPKRQREVVALRFLVDMSERETAAALGLNVGTVKSHAARGLARLRLSVGEV